MRSGANRPAGWPSILVLVRVALEEIADVLDDQVHGHEIVSTARNDDIHVLLRRQAEILERRLDVVRVAGEDVL